MKSHFLLPLSTLPPLLQIVTISWTLSPPFQHDIICGWSLIYLQIFGLIYSYQCLMLTHFKWFKDLWDLYHIVYIFKTSNFNDSSSSNTFSSLLAQKITQVCGCHYLFSNFFVGPKDVRAPILVGSFLLISVCLILKEFPGVFLLPLGCSFNCHYSAFLSL